MATLAIGAAAVVLPLVKQRLELSRAKHRSLTGHSKMAKRFARLVPGYAYGEAEFFQADGAPQEIAERRRAGFERLARTFRERSPRTIELSRRASEHISDLQFTGAYRVPFQFSPYCRENLQLGSFLEAAEGVRLRDLDGNEFFDLTGSYGVNVFGVDFYKACIREGAQRAEALGPVLGGYHRCVADNVARLREISGLDEVSFHMSGTEAVMQAVRLARYHTGRTHLVRFCGAYHGWWDDVQPGPGTPVSPRHTYTLEDMDPAALHVLRTRKDIACVLVNPLQGLHPNSAAPGDSTLVDSGRKAGFNREAYTRWLQELRAVCQQRGIVFILDEIFVGFRLAPRGAQEYFGLQADLVTYGKTLAGGLPIGVLCGRSELMRRFKPDRPADVCFARGTFNSHPYVMTAMQSFFERIKQPEIQALYRDLDATWNRRVDELNAALAQAQLAPRVANLSTIWTVTYAQPCRYNWMLQFYLRAHGLALSWVGTGRFIFSLNYTASDFAEVQRRFLAAAQEMADDGWGWQNPGVTNKSIRRGVLREMLRHRFGL